MYIEYDLYCISLNTALFSLKMYIFHLCVSAWLLGKSYKSDLSKSVLINSSCLATDASHLLTPCGLQSTSQKTIIVLNNSPGCLCALVVECFHHVV